MNRQKILVVYIETGSGHITIANIIARKLAERGDVDVTLADGFSPRQYIARAVFLKGYHVTSVAMRGAYSVFYDIHRIPFVLKLSHALVNWRTAVYLERLILRERVTKIVCTHFALGPACRAALERAKKNLPLVMAVTDPFTAHPSWFMVPSAAYAVFSRELLARAREEFGIADARVFPFPLKDEFARLSEDSRSSRATGARGTQGRVFRVLITGGGEGLPGAVRLARFLIRGEESRVADSAGAGRLAFTVVCGRNAPSYKAFSALAKKTGVPLAVHGYARDMPRLIAQSDCVITKAGASLVMETLAMCKPLIISAYIHGQELGNMRFVVKSGAGWFIQKPKDIFKKLVRLAEDPEYAAQAAKNAQKLDIRAENTALVDFIASL